VDTNNRVTYRELSSDRDFTMFLARTVAAKVALDLRQRADVRERRKKHYLTDAQKSAARLSDEYVQAQHRAAFAHPGALELDAALAAEMSKT
jgi:hypothetical protein